MKTDFLFQMFQIIVFVCVKKNVKKQLVMFQNVHLFSADVCKCVCVVVFFLINTKVRFEKVLFLPIYTVAHINVSINISVLNMQ